MHHFHVEKTTRIRMRLAISLITESLHNINIHNYHNTSQSRTLIEEKPYYFIIKHLSRPLKHRPSSARLSSIVDTLSCHLFIRLEQRLTNDTLFSTTKLGYFFYWLDSCCVSTRNTIISLSHIQMSSFRQTT